MLIWNYTCLLCCIIGSYMANSSVFIVDKNVDYYDYFDKSTSKIKTKFKLNIKNEIVSVKKRCKSIVETPAIKARRAEIELIKAEISSLIGAYRESYSEEYIKNRQSELINCSRILVNCQRV